MGAAEIHLHTIFQEASGGIALAPGFDIYDLLTQPSLFDPMTRRFIPDLNRLHTSWTDQPDWPHAEFVRSAHTLITADCTSKKTGQPKMDHSKKVPLFMHCLAVADDSFRLCKLFGFDDHEATAVWLAGLGHDYLEGAKGDAVQLVHRAQTMATLFNAHDPDVTNLVIGLSKTQVEMPYLVYSGQIGNQSTFPETSTRKAQIAAWLIKFCDSSHNRRADRNQYLDDMKENAQTLRAQGKVLEAMVLEEQVEHKFDKLRMYDINIAMMAAKIGGRIDGDTTCVDFLLSNMGTKFRDPKYDSALRRGLGEGEYVRYQALNQMRNPANENTIAPLPVIKQAL